MSHPDLDAIRAAAARIAPYAHVTPVLRSASLDRIAGCELFFKSEHLQRIGAFKFRGACNAVMSLDEATAARGVVTQSSGNHGAAIALACRIRGIPATVVVPHSAAKIKLAAIRDFGARVVPCEVAQADRTRVTAQVLAQTGGELIHPFDDDRVIAGQATATLELLQHTPDLDVLMAPVSGGGLLSGTALAGKALRPQIEVIGAEPEGARDAHDSQAQGRRIIDPPTDTICDGLRAYLSERTFDIIMRNVAAIELASEAEIIAAMRLIWERLKQAVEPSAAVTLAAILRAPERFRGKRVGVILSGGNVDLDTLPWGLPSAAQA